MPIDFTLPGDGYDPVDYGHDALIAALIEVAPEALSAVLATLPSASGATDTSADAYILGFALAAGASDAVPLAGVAMVPMVQAAMLHQVARRFDTDWDRQRMTEFAGALGAGTLLRVASGFGVRQLVKLVPVYGQTVGSAAAAAASFATTYAMGKAAAHYLNRRRTGDAVRDVARVYKAALAEAFAYSKTHPVARRNRRHIAPRPRHEGPAREIESIRPRQHPRPTLLGITLLLPMLSLVPLGSIWLWQNGYVIAWAMTMLVLVSIAFFFLQRLVVRSTSETATSDRPEDVGRDIWTARQEQAWADVMAFADSVDPSRLASRDGVLALGLETVERVARHDPDHDDPLLRFTLPEAFAVISEASAGLRAFAETSLPFGERITVAQIMWVYRWRTVIPMIEKGYDIWRIVRLFNPIAAATQELRERTTRQLYDMGRDHIARRLTQAFVKEVGRAAVDLYGGSLRVSPSRLGQHVSDATISDGEILDRVAAEPVRILVAGQSGAGKSSLINRLTGTADAAVDVVPSTHRQTAYRLVREGLPEALILDTRARRRRRRRRARPICRGLRHAAVGVIGHARGPCHGPRRARRHPQGHRKGRPPHAAARAGADAHR